MSQTPATYIGKHIVWTVCVGPNDGSQCTDYYPTVSGSNLADWGTAIAAFGQSEPERVYGKRVTARLIETYIDEDADDYDPGDPYASVVDRIVDTYTVKTEIDTDQRDQIHPAIEIADYDGTAQDGATGVAALIDGTYYVYPVVFQDSQFCYQRRCASSYPTGSNTEVCLGANRTNFPFEPYDPDCNPPIYPMDSITAFVPSQNTVENIRYDAEWQYYDLEVDPNKTNLITSDKLYLDMEVQAPAADWQALMKSMMELTYFYNGIYH